MFTKDFNKCRLVLASVGTVLWLYVSLTAGLQWFARSTELRYAVYPFRSEDYLRLLLPHLFKDRGGDRILLTGPSDVREGFLCERFDEAFPRETAFQGAVGGATFDDILLSLEYIEKAYGQEAVPNTLVLGISTRFVGNIPTVDPSLSIGPPAGFPQIGTVNRYSPFFQAEVTADGPRLALKSAWESISARALFLTKQQTRYRASIAAQIMGLLPESGVTGSLKGRLAMKIGPSKYRGLPPFSLEGIREWVQEPGGLWTQTHAWDPTLAEDGIRRRFAWLRAFANRHQIDLYVVNLPEHPYVREGYPPGRYETYSKLIRDVLMDTPFLDLRDYLKAEEFYDTSHALYPAAIRMSDRVIDFIRTERLRRNGSKRQENVSQVGARPGASRLYDQ